MSSCIDGRHRLSCLPDVTDGRQCSKDLTDVIDGQH
jgi:hypothetical protein